MNSNKDINKCVIGIGSNINPEKNIESTIMILKKELQVKAISSWIKTKPIGIVDQDNFTNGAVRIYTTMNKEELTHYLKKLEDRLGRDRTLPKFGPRVIDLDVIVWNGEIVDDDYYKRDFVKKTVDELR